jgi:hypothetical protein
MRVLSKLIAPFRKPKPNQVQYLHCKTVPYHPSPCQLVAILQLALDILRHEKDGWQRSSSETARLGELQLVRLRICWLFCHFSINVQLDGRPSSELRNLGYIRYSCGATEPVKRRPSATTPTRNSEKLREERAVWQVIAHTRVDMAATDLLTEGPC